MTPPARTTRPRRARSLRRRVGRSFLAVLVVYLLLSAAILVSLLVLTSRGNEVIYRWQPAYTRSAAVLGDLVNEETGIRGYALSGAKASLQPYYEYLAQRRTDEAALRSNLGHDAELLGDLDRFDAAADHWRTRYAERVIATVRAGHLSAAGRIASGLDAKQAFDAIRSEAARMTDRIHDLREQYKGERRDAVTVTWVFFAGAVVLVLTVGVLLWRGMRRSVLEPVEVLAAQTREVAAGSIEQVIVPTGPPEIAALGSDVDAMRARIAEELARVEAARMQLLARTDDLARSNADLEQFAYVASHDLSEPLRKVANFCQLLERQYADQLDDKARQYIAFAVDGAKRMQVLITDLLAFSRVGRTTEEFAEVDLNDVVDRALANLEGRVAETGADVVHGRLPTVRGDASLLTALFQNLIGNSIKYRGEDTPHVRISPHREAKQWQFTVSDNGIGIDPKYGERIFAIFQRLHLRDQYGGTGIGLAMCRKIVEFHGGRIWLGEANGAGATFQFTLADRAAEPAGAPPRRESR